MMKHSVQPRDWIFVKSYGFLSFAENMGKNIGKYTTKNLSDKSSQNLIMVNNLQQIHLTLFFKKTIQKTAEASDW